MASQKALLLVGSPRGEKSASRALGKRLLSALESQGISTEIHSIYGAWASEGKRKVMLDALDGAGIVILAFPLYVDQLPALVIRTLDLIASRRFESGAGDRPKLAAIVQCGFPETHQNIPAVEIMHRFADLAGFEWAGGLAMGMGGAAEGRLTDKPSGMFRNVVRALDRAAADLAEGRPISPEAVDAFGKPLMPLKLYFFGANFGWRRQAKKSGRGINLYAKPYAEQ